MANTIDLYSTRTMMRILETTFPPATFLRDTFFTETDFADGEFVDIDVIKGKRKMAPFVHPRHKGKLDLRQGYTTKTLKPPYIKVYRPSEAADFIKRSPGENLYSPQSRGQKEIALMTKDLFELNEQITRREEWMCAQQLTSGAVNIDGEGVSVTITLDLTSGHALANTDLIANGWATASTAKPLDDLDALQLTISKDSGRVARDVMMGETAWAKFIASDQVLAEWLPSGGQAIGTALILGDSVTGPIFRGVARSKNIWTYNELFLEDDGSTVGKMIPDKKVVMIARGAMAVKHYGIILDLAVPGGAKVRVFPKSYEEDNPSVRYVLLQSAPLPFFHEVDAFGYMQVIA